MDQLPVSLVSNDLKYSLTSIKIKTLEKAREFMINQSQQEKNKEKIKKIEKYTTRYDNIKNNIITSLNMLYTDRLNQQYCGIDQLKSKTVSNQDIFNSPITQPCMVEIYGQKCTGKTCFLMNFCEQYAKKSDKTIYLINSASGVTLKRFERLAKQCPKFEYRDTYLLQHVLQVCKSAAQDKNLGCIALDALTNLLMEEEKTLIFLIKLFKIFSQLVSRGVTIYFTNYVQTWFEFRDEETCMNNYPYFSAITSQFIKYKYLLHREVESKQLKFQMVRGGQIKGEYSIQNDGLKSLKVFD